MLDSILEWLKKVIYLFVNEVNFNFLGAIASILGLFITLSIYFNIRKIKKTYVVKGRGPDEVLNLSEIISQLNDSYADFENFTNEIDILLSKIEVSIEWFYKYVTKDIKKNIKSVNKIIAEYRMIPQLSERKELVWKIYTNLVKVHTQLDVMFKDNKWI